MTKTLQKLSMFGALLVASGALVWQNAARAQDEELSPLLRGVGARRVLGRDEAAKSFAELLRYTARPDTPYSPYSESPDRISYENMTSSIARRSFEQLRGKTEDLLLALAAQWKQPQRTVRVQSESAGSATVVIEESPPAARPLVLIQENGAWGVDLVETYAAWNDLQGEAKSEAKAAAIYRLTQVELPGFRLTPELRETRDIEQRASCQTNLKQIGLAMTQYSQDWDEKFPPAKPWSEALDPYLKNRQLFNCPAVPGNRGFGYAYNSKLSNKPLAVVAESAQTVAVYETTILKPNAFGLGENPAFRHLGGANYAFVDGHVKWFAKTIVPSFKLQP